MLKRSLLMTKAAGLGAVLVIATSCSSSPEENVSQACEASEAYAADLQKFEDVLTPEATVEQIRTARDEVSSSHDDLVEESQDVAEDRVAALESAKEDFLEAVDELPDEATVPEAAEDLQDDVDAVKSARSSVASELSC